MRSRIELTLASERKSKLCKVAASYGLSVSEYFSGLIDKVVPSPKPLNFHEKRAREVETLIPQKIVRELLAERQKCPPTPYRELARKYGYGLRTVNRACTGQGGYRTKVKRAASGRKSRLTPEQLAGILIDSKSISVMALAKKYQVSRFVVFRAIARERCYARES